jgi:hypothetical protein
MLLLLLLVLPHVAPLLCSRKPLLMAMDRSRCFNVFTRLIFGQSVDWTSPGRGTRFGTDTCLTGSRAALLCASEPFVLLVIQPIRTASQFRLGIWTIGLLPLIEA